MEKEFIIHEDFYGNRREYFYNSTKARKFILEKLCKIFSLMIERAYFC